ncbi:hypothetical protein WN55_01797 [Dufourea novaeangliae]|uniref:Uncharacterized protein n=1 Tax=Dufourea novaeangliae TaxID=178035 RepID=A0A154PDS2_DUFNO|nr:hypothetical protein WN55_01797 [Dufourea novaeangliae]
MATLLITRHWESGESLTAAGKTFSNKSKCLSTARPQEISQNEKLLSESCGFQNQIVSSKYSSQRRTLNMLPKTANARLTKIHDDTFLEPSHVKVSALLYEITERTNELAQPRARLVDPKTHQPPLTTSQIPKASQRIIELSKPRVMYQQPSKPIGYVSRSALHAVGSYHSSLLIIFFILL